MPLAMLANIEERSALMLITWPGFGIAGAVDDLAVNQDMAMRHRLCVNDEAKPPRYTAVTSAFPVLQQVAGDASTTLGLLIDEPC